MKPRCPSPFLFLAVVAAACTRPAPAQPPDRPPDNATAARITDGVEKAQAGKLLDAVEQFQRVLDTAGDDLVPVGPYHHTMARWVIHGHLTRLPADGVKLYRQRVDGQAAKRLDEAKKSRDDAGLQKLLADMFAAKASEEAILELARRSFERAEFDAAEHYWRMLLPPAGDDDRLLHFPGPRTESAAIQARLILVKLFRGEREEARADLKTLREKYPQATGLLAGKTGKYADTLTALSNAPETTTLPRPPDLPGWPTFAGSATRIGTARTRLPYFWPDLPTWHAPLDKLPRDSTREPPPDGLHPRALAFHPVIADGRAYVADGAQVFAINLMTGELKVAAHPVGGQDTRIPTRHDLRHTLTEADGILYARLGAAALKSAEAGADGNSFILALGARKGETEERDALWRLDPPAFIGATAHFEGAPIVFQGRMYVGFWRSAGAEPMAGIACYQIDDPKSPPDLVWQRIVGKSGSEPNGETRFRHELVTISGPNVVYCTDGGTVAALDAQNGRPAWEYRYPRNERATLPRYRDLCPPLADGGRIYVAPADTDRLMCLDAFTGRLIWEREGVEVVHLLGVAKGRLIATFGGPLRGIRGLNLRTGADSGPGGWTIHDDGGEQTFGRGLVSEEAVVWPTKNAIHFLDPTDGAPLRAPIPGVFGNLCYADGVLVVTTATDVWGYVTEAKKVGERRKAVEADPGNPIAHAELAESLIDAGEFVEAETEAAKAGEAKARLLWLLAEKIIRDGDRVRATRIYQELAKGDGSYAAAGAVRLAESVGDPAKSREAWRRVFARKGSIRDEHGIPYSLGVYAEKRFGDALSMHATGLGDFSELNPPAKEGQPPRPGLIPTQTMTLDDPSIHILGTSDHGILAAGSYPYFCAPDEARRLRNPGDGTSLLRYGQQLLITGATALSELSVHTDHGQWEIREPGPSVSHLDRPLLPVASDHDDRTTIRDVRFDGTGLSFVHNGRLIVSMGWSWHQVEIRSSPVGHTSGLYDNFFLGPPDIAQTRSGRMLVWNRNDPRPREFRCTEKRWPEPPVPVEDNRFLIPDDGAVSLFDAKAGKELARYTIPEADTLSGELPRFRIHQGDLLLLIDRNHGIELDRFQIDGLQRAWDRSPVFVGRELDDVAFADDRFFTAADGILAAHSWKDGRLLWEAPLPDAPHTRWKLTVCPQGLLVHPAEALVLDPHFDAIGEFRRAGWDRGRLLAAACKSYDAWTARELPILVLDPADGRLIQRLTFPAAGPAAGVAVTSRGVVVVTGRGSWTLTSR